MKPCVPVLRPPGAGPRAPVTWLSTGSLLPGHTLPGGLGWGAGGRGSQPGHAPSSPPRAPCIQGPYLGCPCGALWWPSAERPGTHGLSRMSTFGHGHGYRPGQWQTLLGFGKVPGAGGDAASHHDPLRSDPGETHPHPPVPVRQGLPRPEGLPEQGTLAGALPSVTPGLWGPGPAVLEPETLTTPTGQRGAYPRGRARRLGFAAGQERVPDAALPGTDGSSFEL